MTTLTSASANKLLRKLYEEKEYWVSKEVRNNYYVASLEEEPVIPEYDFDETNARLTDIDNKIVKIKHAVNLVNASNEIKVGDEQLSIDSILIRMAQLNKRKCTLDNMRRANPKSRNEYDRFSRGSSVPEYRYINYDLNKVREEYSQVDKQITDMQLALDKFNQTFEFDVDI